MFQVIPRSQDFCHSHGQASEGPSWDGGVTGWQGGRPSLPQAVWINEEGKQGVVVLPQPSKGASDFCKGGEGSRRLRIGAREAGGEGTHGGAIVSARASSRKQNRPCVSS